MFSKKLRTIRMIAEELVNPMIPVLKSDDSVERALDVMQGCNIGQLAMVDDDSFKGLCDEDLLLNCINDETLLNNLPMSDPTAVAHVYQHVYELISLANRHKLKVIPVLDEGNLYAGSIVVNEMLERFADSLGIQEAGAVIVLKMPNYNYSMAEISRLIESNNVKIISSFFSEARYGMPNEATLTLKLNKTEVTATVATLERFGYEIDGIYGGKSVDNLDKQRLDSLLRYLQT
jgi:acetoin utilization protein AcuB